MADRIPFVAYIKIVPDRVEGKRFEIQRSREKLAYWIYQNLAAYGGNTGDEHLTLAEPGSGVTFQIDDQWLATLAGGAAFKPQFGEDPDMVMIVGFASIDDPAYTDPPTTPPCPEISIINAGVVKSGPATSISGWKNNGSTIQNQIGARILKDTIDTIISGDGEVISLEFKGVRYGRRGFHFIPSVSGTA